LFSVLTWELRRFRASRLFWLQALGFFFLTLFVTWFGRTPENFTVGIRNVSLNGFVAGTSAWGLFQTYPGYVLLLGMLLPFVNADGVSRDVHRRTHELLMSTPVPSWAYVWGRYLTGLVMSLGLAILMLAGILGMGFLLHLTLVDYPAPVIGTVLTLWGSMIVPATVLAGSISFAVGTLLPQQANLARIIVLVGWFIAVVILPTAQSTLPTKYSLPTWYINWDPTSAATARYMLLDHYQPTFEHLSLPSTEAQFQHALLTIENSLPDISAWLVPHLFLAALGLVLVAVAAFTFRRFRGALGSAV
jgi:ABC-type transport system involved in multi-copper enzyme maturation permease subunit